MTDKTILFNEAISDKRFIAAILVLLLCNFVIYKHLFSGKGNPEEAFKAEFPKMISNWSSTEVKYDPAVISSLDPDKTVYRDYHNESGHTVSLFMACYNSMEKADLSHSPIVCFTGQGWDIQDTSVMDISIGNSENQNIKVNRMIQKKADLIMVTFYWYQSKNMTFSNRGLQKVFLFYQGLIGNSEANAFVRLTVIEDKKDSAEKNETLIKDFVKVFYPELRRFYN